MSETTLTEEVEAIAAATVTTVQHAVQEHPIATVAASVGAGYVLGVGIPSWVVKAGATIGTRILFREVVAAAMSSLNPNATKPGTEVETEVVPNRPSS